MGEDSTNLSNKITLSSICRFLYGQHRWKKGDFTHQAFIFQLTGINGSPSNITVASSSSVIPENTKKIINTATLLNWPTVEVENGTLRIFFM